MSVTLTNKRARMRIFVLTHADYCDAHTACAFVSGSTSRRT